MSDEKLEAKQREMLKYLLEELLTTEKSYIAGLKVVVERYLAQFHAENNPIVKIPEDLKEYKVQYVFANIQEIYEWHRDFFVKSLAKNLYNYADLGKCFLSCESQFHMYGRYSNNRSISEFIVSEYMDYFNKVRCTIPKDKETKGMDFSLNALLMTPCQRLPRYELLLSKIVRNLKELNMKDCEDLIRAHEMIKRVLKSVDDMTALHGIKDYNGNIFDLGKLILHQFLRCKYIEKNKQKKMRYYVFLFKRLMIFTEKHESTRKFANPTYSYKLQIPMNKLKVRKCSENTFLLTSSDPNIISPLNIFCSGETEEVHEHWLEHIQDQLRLQEDLIADLVNPSVHEERREGLM